ncbi:sugar ABC transporter permease [Nonomuraea sp. K274]|uniref:Sugar ABC transporter permease n=1 Tax=Nonomuraea cypriaca TaxID=1187855 RepID=A0A931AFZ7_9ACTN|nr:sugar ABC transporter permease [Nonomuraea cypriaca]MBF8191263.1 sugar ABC transporter permease [Nonomuraea cypriaca]
MRRRRTLSGRYARTAYLFLTPAILFFGAFFYLPIGNVVATSLRSGPQADQWAGLGNYTQAMADPAVRHSFLVTVGFALMVVLGSIVLGLALAMALDQPLKGRVAFRVMLLVPYLTSVAIVGLLWRNILDPELGVLNRLLHALGLPGQHWLNTAPLITIAAVTLWQSVGHTMVLFLAGLQGIPETYHEAAKIDGADPWRRFWRITLPLLAPTTLFVSVMAVISGLQAFGQAFIITNGGPGDATDLSVFHIFNVAFRARDFGYSSAQSVLLLFVIVAFTLVQLRAGRRGEVTY